MRFNDLLFTQSVISLTVTLIINHRDTKFQQRPYIRETMHSALNL